MRHCKTCGGAIAELGEVTMWAGKWCHCGQSYIQNTIPAMPIQEMQQNLDLLAQLQALQTANQQLQAENEKLKNVVIEASTQVEILEIENAELKAKLKNAICPKFEVGQKVIYNAKYLHKFIIDKRIIDKDGNLKYESIGYRLFDESELFATEAEALASLEAAQAGGK